MDGEHIVWKGLINGQKGQMDGLRKDSMERVDRWIDGEHMIWKGLIDGQKGQMDRKDRWLDGEYIVWKGLIDGQKGYGTEQINLIKPKEF